MPAAAQGIAHFSSAAAGQPSLPDAAPLERELASSSGGHPHYALFFLFTALLIGVILTHVITLPFLHGLQQTVVLFVVGVIYSLLLEGLDLKSSFGPMGDSYEMWMAIDPHLLLFALLPVLLAGDAMTIDTNVARQTAKQCIYLAGPGVLISALTTALFLWGYLPVNWSFLLCLTCGSIFAATDPVAVVGLLKELGASPVLTVQIQGESLLNDGTAIVLYTVAYDMVKGETYDASKVILFLVKTVFGAILLGFVIGWVFVFWIRLASNRFEHNTAIIQITLTVCCAYWSFLLSEGLFGISGVLCTVASSLVLADKMRLDIVHKESMEHVWHEIEYVGNTIIFFLAGALTGKAMIGMPFLDYVHLLVIYLVCFVIRGAFLLASRPILRILNPEKKPLPYSDIAVMTWGGLRGAVGLALAIQVAIERGGGKLSGGDADRVLFYTGGLASLTLVINAATSPALVRALKITKTSQTKELILLGVHKHLLKMVEEKTADSHPIRKVLNEVLDDVLHHVTKQGVMTRADVMAQFASRKIKGGFSRTKGPAFKDGELQDPQWLFDMLDKAQYYLDQAPKDRLELLTEIPKLVVTGEKLQELKSLISNNTATYTKLKAMGEVGLRLVNASYWEMLEQGDLGTSHTFAEALLQSTVIPQDKLTFSNPDLKYLLKVAGIRPIDEESVNRIPSSGLTCGRTDEYTYQAPSSAPSQTSIGQLRAFLNISKGETGGAGAQPPSSPTSRGLPAGSRWTPRAIVHAMWFHLFVATLIVLNLVFIILEEFNEGDRSKTPRNLKDTPWFVIEVVFTALFACECLIRIAAYLCRYFADPWNLFDLTLVLLGLGDIIFRVSFSRRQDALNFGSELGVLRFKRALSILRFIRVIRFVRFTKEIEAMVRRKHVNFLLQQQLERVTALAAFVRAHVSSQKLIMDFFGGGRADEGPMTVDEAYVVISSQVGVLQALAMAAHEASLIDKRVLRGMRRLRRTTLFAQDLIETVEVAQGAGMITAREAQCFVHPLQDHEKRVALLLGDMLGGFEEDDYVDEIGRDESGLLTLERCISGGMMSPRKKSAPKASPGRGLGVWGLS